MANKDLPIVKRKKRVTIGAEYEEESSSESSESEDKHLSTEPDPMEDTLFKRRATIRINSLLAKEYKEKLVSK